MFHVERFTHGRQSGGRVGGGKELNHRHTTHIKIGNLNLENLMESVGNDEVINKVAKQFENNALLMAMFYCPHYFRVESPAFHLQLLKVSNEAMNLAVQAPRGSAKSSILVFVRTLHSIVFKRDRFIVIVQNTYQKASRSLEALKDEIKNNDRLRASYGISLSKDAEGDSVFLHRDGYSVRVLCKGADQLGSIRGEKFGAYRPTLILVDDLEDDEMVRNIERRVSLETVFNEVIKYAGENGVTRTIVVGTILHDDSLMAKLVSKEHYKHFTKLFYRARYLVDGRKVSLWEQRWTVDDLDRMEAEDPSGFAKEMQGDPSSGSLETIQRADFRYWSIVDNLATLYNNDSSVTSRWDLKDCQAAIAIDLAWENNKNSDFSAIMPGYVTPNNDLLFGSYINKRGLRPDELEEIIFTLSAKLEAQTGKRVQIGFEKSKLEKVLKWFLQEAQRRRNQWLWLKDINWGSKDKVERVLSRLGNRYSQHSIYHQKGMGELENQLIRLRSVAHDDLADVAGMLPEMLSYASNKRPVEKKEDKFEWLIKQTRLYKEKNKSPYVFGSKTKELFKSKIGI